MYLTNLVDFKETYIVTRPVLMCGLATLKAVTCQ
jgi:hypothetical protein